MDLRDSSTSTASTRDVSSGDEDALLSVTAGLAKDAALLFQSRRFSECIDVLNQLLLKKEDDPKVMHNIAVAEYFRDGGSDPRKLIEVLNKVKKRIEDLSHEAREQVEIGSNIVSTVISGSKGSSTSLHQFSSASSTNIAYTDGFDTSIATLNIAVLLFHLHEYAKAISLLEPLYQKIEPMGEPSALDICLLLLDIALASKDAKRASEVIQDVEKAFGAGYMLGQGEHISSAQHQSSDLPVKTSSASSNSTVLDKSNLYSIASANLSENPLARTLSDEVLDYEALLSTLDIDGQNLARSGGLPSSNDQLRTSVDRPGPAVDLKLKLHLYKVRLFLLTRNLKAMKREIKLAMNIALGIDSSTVLLLKSQVEYARGNHDKALEILMTLRDETELGMPSIFNNNLGCMYHQLGKHHTSTVLFSKALKSSSSLRSDKPLKLSTFSQDKSLLIMYNCGLQYLTCGRPAVAARCFQKASTVFYKQPLLWLRIAECCLLALEQGLLQSAGAPTDEKVRVHVVGKGKWRQLVVDGTSRNRNLDFLELDDGSLCVDGQTKLSVPFARQCLLNALQLLNSIELKSLKAGLPTGLGEDESSQAASLKNSNKKNLAGVDSKASNIAVVSAQVGANGDMKDPMGGESLNTNLHSSVSVYEDICRRENCMVKQAVLANLAYIELNLENPLKALLASKCLLNLPECSRIYTFLGHVYAAEALCYLNRPKEAAEHLLVYILDGNNIELPYSEEDTEKWSVVKGEDVNNGGSVDARNPPWEESQGSAFLKPEEARGTLYVNLSAMYAMQGDLRKANLFAMKALSAIPNSRKAILTSIYVDLLFGKSQDALVKLKQSSAVRLFRTALTLNSF